MRSSIVFALALGLAATLLGWWVVFQVRDAAAVERAGRALASADLDGAAQALGAADVADLRRLANSRRRMFLSEAVVFGCLLAATAILFVRSKRHEQTVLDSHSRFLAGATHELKTPLATIRLGLESIEHGRLGSDASARYVDMMLLEVDRLERGLSNVLEAAALRAEGLVLHTERGDLADDLRTAVESLRARAIAAEVELALGELPQIRVDRDAKAMQTVFHNLIDNAIKFSAAGQRVALRMGKHGDRAVVEIVDEGHGIEPADLAGMFLPFWRGESAKGGSGLGLHLAREIVRTHGGELTAHSGGRGQGATLRVELPCVGVAS
ncbi:MAG: sensor histidine kinase [Planctomycetota bacterium]